MPSAAYVNTLLFGVYPYVCLSVLLIGSLIRFDREPYTWKSDSSQMLRAGQLRLGSNLFHYGVIVVIAAACSTWIFSRFPINRADHEARIAALSATEATGLQ